MQFGVGLHYFTEVTNICTLQFRYVCFLVKRSHVLVMPCPHRRSHTIVCKSKTAAATLTL